ncbi:hypothetical protein cje21_04972, partial [Campylobacter jejuni subsp. jejuni 1997-7]
PLIIFAFLDIIYYIGRKLKIYNLESFQKLSSYYQVKLFPLL